MCHHTSGTNGYELISIADPAVQSHIDHGDATPGGDVPDMLGFKFDADCNPIAVPPQRWTPVNQQFPGGGNLIGSFDYNALTGVASNVNLSEMGGGLAFTNVLNFSGTAVIFSTAAGGT